MSRAAKEFFTHTGLTAVLIEGRGWRRHPIYLVDPKASAWDGAGPTTNAALWTDRWDIFMYAEVKITGRAPRAHKHGVWGTKARVRFTAKDDTGEWVDAVVRPTGEHEPLA